MSSISGGLVRFFRDSRVGAPPSLSVVVVAPPLNPRTSRPSSIPPATHTQKPQATNVVTKSVLSQQGMN